MERMTILYLFIAIIVKGLDDYCFVEGFFSIRQNITCSQIVIDTDYKWILCPYNGGFPRMEYTED